MPSIPLLLSLCVSAAPQDPAEVLARFTLAGKEAVVTRDDVALELAFHQRRREDGRAGCEHLVDTWLVRTEAAKAGVQPSRDEVQAFWQQLQQQIKAQGQDPMQMPIVKNSGEDALLADLTVTLAHERLVRKELELGKNERVTPEMLGLWLQDERLQHTIVTDPDKLPVGVAVRIDQTDIAIAELGTLLLRRSQPEDLDQMIQQVAWLRSLHALAAEHKVTIDAAEVDLELRARAEAARHDPRLGGIPFEQMLQAQGLTPQALKQSRVFVAQTLLKKVAAVLHPRSELLAALAADRNGVLERAGARRRLAVVYARATDTPNELIPRTFADAVAFLTKAKERLARETFANVARIESEDPGSKARGGDLGWFHATSKMLPAPVLAAAFALPRDGVSEPIQAEDGCYLIKVTDVEPEPSDEQIVERLREQHVDALMKQLLVDADLRRADGKPFEVRR
ncbi:MAG: peptidyl-prolyl cis-trans isomerase [Planctomycetes bacterium]|nr:peptidyl-prolyl cis-trans isomerase [Planctomycetota bacterium]